MLTVKQWLPERHAIGAHVCWRQKLRAHKKLITKMITVRPKVDVGRGAARNIAWEEDKLPTLHEYRRIFILHVHVTATQQGEDEDEG
jgi:hypothetical protein